ncbi:MAG: TraR/DksA family transcriptional regulator [Gammaproteobacteria bacterium]|nr:MAG: TraR/DksA family transcriptional regulator [Gammaproteobacteria bacterium]
MDYLKFKRLLLKRQDEIKNSLLQLNQAGQTVELDQAMMGRLSRMDAMQGQEMAKASKQRAELELKKIDAALTRIDNNEYGYCVKCDEQISEKRLEFDPTALFCIDCAN